ncbi:rRNA 2'-O-methyltransferase fibrillarin [Drosophila mojavensis]|uniref:rRNA 2'-O-methyltransferase fibrillarin n=1 Tax=Drosophila mojavensis TaxID=7230 RepID=B4K8K2_DROMO|nr:rRNA 2'-O-methyltransferase fibrillarin [Drosophila mojavensis]EDW14401.1 uncharacterized protein Dmoj_GI24236 [Drosophila mojavensis]
MNKLFVSKHKWRRRGNTKSRGWSKLADLVEVDSNEVSDSCSEHSNNSLTSFNHKSELSIEQQQFSGAFVSRGKDDSLQLMTRCSAVIEDGFGEETLVADYNGECCRFRIWSPYKSKLAAALLKDLAHVPIFEGSKVMYLGAATGCSVSHLADIVGAGGVVYAVETSPWANSELLSLAKRRSNVVAIIEDATMPYKYHRVISESVDFLFCDTLHHEQLRILMLHARHFLRPGGRFALMLTGTPQDAAGIGAVSRLHAEQLDALDQISLQPYVHGQFLLAGVYNLTIPESLVDA